MCFAALLLLVTLTTTASAGYQGEGSLSCLPSPASPGSSVTCTGTGFEPGAEVTFTLGGSAIGTATADADGNASITFTVPSGATASASFTASGMGANGTLLELSTVLGVSLAAGATTTVGSASDPLPVTGSDATGDLARLGVVLIAGGALAVLVVKHRRASALAA